MPNEELNKVQGNYIAVKSNDGKWTIKDVPIFAEVKDEDSKIGRKVSVKILQKLVDRAQMRAKENYFPPLHVNHHEDNKMVFQVGFFLPTKVDTIIYENENTAVIFADLLNIEDPTYQAIKQAKLPYRSVELFGLDTDEPEITSLALLEHETPFFRLPLLTVKEEVDQSGKQISLQNNKCVKAFQNTNKDGTRCRILFSLGGIKDMPNKFVEETKDKTPEEKKKAFMEMSSDEKIEALYDMIMAKEEKPKDEEEDKDKNKPKEPETQKATGPVDLKNGTPNPKDSEIFKLEGRVVALENEKVKAKLVENGMKELAKFNINGIKEKLTAVADKGGENAVKHFIEGIKETAVIDPPTNFDLINGKPTDQDPDLMTFSQQGPEIFAMALEGARAFELVKRNTSVNRKLFIEKYIEGKKAGGQFIQEDLANK